MIIKNTKGFSMVELMVTVAMLALLMGGAIAGFGILSGRSVKDAADKMESLLNSHKTVAMGKIDSYGLLYTDADGATYFEEYIVDFDKDETSEPVFVRRELVAKKEVITRYRLTNSGKSYTNLGTRDNPLYISFDRSTGGFKDLRRMNAGYENVYLDTIEFKRGNTVRQIRLSYLTGKIIR